MHLALKEEVLLVEFLLTLDQFDNERELLGQARCSELRQPFLLVGVERGKCIAHFLGGVWASALGD